MIDLPSDIYSMLEQVQWLSMAGHGDPPQFDFPVVFLDSQEAALKAFKSNPWADVKTEAQGDLTGYLAKHHPDLYGGYWNKLARQSRALIEKVVVTKLPGALSDKGFPAEMFEPILVDLNRAALEIAYHRKFPKSPVFFERLLRIYEAGRLPCGWNGDLSSWPTGSVLAF